MTLSKLVVFLTAAVFFVYGAGFVLAPEYLSQMVTDWTPSTASSLIDMRATYGGMSIAVGILLFVLLREELRLGLIGVVLLMLSMATTRAYGIFTDGAANTFMYSYLVLEIVIGIAAVGLLAQTRK